MFFGGGTLTGGRVISNNAENILFTYSLRSDQRNRLAKEIVITDNLPTYTNDQG